MKALLPSLREKKRYLVFKLIGNQVNARTAKNEIYKKSEWNK